MKLFLCGILVILLYPSCSKPSVIDDPVIGIWHNHVKTATNTHKLMVDQEEWIFNDAQLGRYHGYRNGKIVFLTDFGWKVREGVYTVTYPGTDFVPDIVLMDHTEGQQILRTQEGGIRAVRVER